MRKKRVASGSGPPDRRRERGVDGCLRETPPLARWREGPVHHR